MPLCNGEIAMPVLQDGTTDKLFHSLYEPIISRIVDVYDPGAIVLQCGADSLAADRLGNFSMTIAGAPLSCTFILQCALPLHGRGTRFLFGGTLR